jgi:release factor glutamine methyltransferase
MNVKRSTGRLFLWLRFQLFQRHRFNRLVLERVAGRPFLILPEVFNPTLFLTSEFMARSLNESLVPPGCHFLDMGTGSGVGAVFAAQWAGCVAAVDVNEAAVRCARINALLNGVEEQVTVYHGDLFAPLAGQRFDVVLFNPPYYRGEPQTMFDRAFRATDVVERFAAELTGHLTPTGHALVLLSSDGDEAPFLDCFRRHHFTVTVAAQRRLAAEVVTLYQLTNPL